MARCGILKDFLLSKWLNDFQIFRITGKCILLIKLKVLWTTVSKAWDDHNRLSVLTWLLHTGGFNYYLFYKITENQQIHFFRTFIVNLNNKNNIKISKTSQFIFTYIQWLFRFWSVFIAVSSSFRLNNRRASWMVLDVLWGNDDETVTKTFQNWKNHCMICVW